jgi:hypothetical protein
VVSNSFVTDVVAVAAMLAAAGVAGCAFRRQRSRLAVTGEPSTSWA